VNVRREDAEVIALAGGERARELVVELLDQVAAASGQVAAASDDRSGS
jgi:hypothetical protein